MVNQKKNKNFAPEPKSLLDLGSGANFFLPMVNQKRLRLRGVEGPLYRHASEGILSSLSLPLSLSLSIYLSFSLSPSLSPCKQQSGLQKSDLGRAVGGIPPFRLL